MDDKMARDVMAQLIRLVKAQERTADALEVANAADPVQAIQAALEAGDRAAAPEDAPLDDETELANIRAYVAALR